VATIRGEVLLAHGRQPRRRFSPAEKIALVEETAAPGMSVSAVARKFEISPSQLFNWRRLMKNGEMTAVENEEEVVPASEVKALKAKIRELERSLGKKAHEVELLKELVELAKEKKLISPSQPSGKRDSK
jgi:transposase